MSSGRVLGLDLGEARIGVAISDDDRRVAVPFGTVRTGAPADVKAIAAIVREEGVTQIVVGLPLQLSGRTGEAAEHARTFAGALQEALRLPVSLQDERLSSREAESRLAVLDKDWRSRKARLDAAAAAVILQDYLDGRA